MENQKITALMSAKGITKSSLSGMTGISQTTLNRIINNKIQHVKMYQMEAIARALGTSVHAIFDLPQEHAVTAAIRPEEAGLAVTKLLHPDESFLIFWFQNSSNDRRKLIFETARTEYNKTLAEIQNRSIDIVVEEKTEDQYEQLSLF